MDNILEKYKNEISVFDIPSLFDYQIEAIQQLTDGVNTLCIVPTGGGKSLVYQLAGLELGGVTIVVSPLKALMQEQVNYLNKKKQIALALTSDIPFQEQRAILRQLSSSTIKFLYLSPERLQNSFFRAALIKAGKIYTQLVIDEAHCVSQWGFDFRPEYADISSFQKFLLQNNFKPVVCALTATLSVKAVNDIKREFTIVSKIIYSSNSVIRPELKLFTEKVAGKKNEEEKWMKVLAFLENHNCKKAIIYLYSKKKCEQFATRFNAEKPIKDRVANFFHSDDDGKEKDKKREEFKAGEINFLFATTAFGMGMNIPDIDCIIQYHLPKSIEEYYQQVGRGARDKRKCPVSNCLLIWSDKNIKSNIEEIEKERSDFQTINRAIEQLNLKDKRKGAKSSIGFSEFLNAKINLAKYKFYFERFDVIKTIGEINGGPNSIRFIKETVEWTNIKKAAIGNSFIIAAKSTGKSVQDLINYVHEQDLKGNVEFLPAMEKKIFMEKLVDHIPEDIKKQIVDDIDEKVEYHLERFKLLEGFCESESPVEFLTKVFKNIS